MIEKFLPDFFKKPLREPLLRARSVFISKSMLSLYPQKKLFKLLKEFNEKNIVFTITAGRTGTETLSRVFSTIPGVYSTHEPRPAYHEILYDAQTDPVLSVAFMLYKARAINRVHSQYYLETSHVFCKGFFEPCIALGLCPSFVIVTRDLRKTAISLLGKTAVPNRTEAGKSYLIHPDNFSYVTLDSWADLSDYELCYWYCL